MVEASRYIVKSLEKAFSIIELFDTKLAELSATEIATRLGTIPGGLYPALYTLEKHGYLKRDKNKKYSLGLKFLERGNLILQQLDLRDKVKPYLKELANTYKVNAHLAILYDWKVLYLHREEGFPAVIIKEIIGQRAPAYCTALGKVLLASLDERKLNAYLAKEEFKPLTSNTITDPLKLREGLKLVQERGYAIDNEEFHKGVICIAAPVKNYQGKTVAAVSISLPKGKFADERAQKSLIIQVMDAALGSSKELGYQFNENGPKISMEQEVKTPAASCGVSSGGLL